MTNTTHTPEPWKVEEWNIGESHRQQTVIRGQNDAIAYVQDLWCPDQREMERDANATRIVACVNACQGINPESVPLMLEALKELRRQVKVMAMRAGCPEHHIFHHMSLKAADEAIAKATGAQS